MDPAVSAESLQYAVAVINAVKDSPLGLLALICLGVGFIFYLISAFRGFDLYAFGAYVLTLAFFGFVVLAIYRTSGTIKTIYYAGEASGHFNVGRLTRISDSEWQDSSIITQGALTTGYTYHFIKPQYQGKTLILQADPGERDGAIEIDFASGIIWWLDVNQAKIRLYQILVTL